MQKTKIGIVTAWGECGMGYIANNWIYTIQKYPDLLEYKIFCRAVDKFTPFRWYGNNVTQGYESMDVNNSIFWDWVDDYKPDIILSKVIEGKLNKYLEEIISLTLLSMGYENDNSKIENRAGFFYGHLFPKNKYQQNGNKLNLNQ